MDNLPRRRDDLVAPVGLPDIPLSDELLENLRQPLDPRAARIMAEIAQAEQAKDARHIIPFPFRGSDGHLVRDSNDHLTIVSGEPPVLKAAC